MGSKKKILIIHPEGNIFNNPNLLSIATNLSNEYDVDVLMPDSLYIERSEFKIILYNSIWNKIKNKINNIFLYKFFFNFFRMHLKEKYDFIFGVDRIGIIDAYLFSKSMKCNYALISYEILFEDETSKRYKKIEIKSCKKLVFAIVQDEKRAHYLSNENMIERSKMIYIPVASDGLAIRKKKSLILHKKFNLPLNKKILIFTGSVAQWTCIDEIIRKAKDFLPPDWVLVIHDRYGEAKKNIVKMGLSSVLEENIFLIEDSIFSFEEIDLILSDAELGIVSYYPIADSPYTGKNIEYIGLSSGKFSTYMKNGLPVIIYKATDLRDVVINNELGLYIDNLDDLYTILDFYKGRDYFEKNCLLYFNQILSFDNYKSHLKDELKYFVN